MYHYLSNVIFLMYCEHSDMILVYYCILLSLYHHGLREINKLKLKSIKGNLTVVYCQFIMTVGICSHSCHNAG